MNLTMAFHTRHSCAEHFLIYYTEQPPGFHIGFVPARTAEGSGRHPQCSGAARHLNTMSAPALDHAHSHGSLNAYSAACRRIWAAI